MKEHFPWDKKYENKSILIKIQFSIEWTGSQGRVIGPNESFIKSYEKKYENDNLGWERMEKTENYVFN